MKFIDEYRDVELAKKLVARIGRLSKKQSRLMEFHRPSQCSRILGLHLDLSK